MQTFISDEDRKNKNIHYFLKMTSFAYKNNTSRSALLGFKCNLIKRFIPSYDANSSVATLFFFKLFPGGGSCTPFSSVEFPIKKNLQLGSTA
jgi:hypothetical protein